MAIALDSHAGSPFDTSSTRAAGSAAVDLGSALRRLRGAFGEVILASTVINLLALATPLFMMTVYNKVIGHAALETLDVLAIGMLGLFVFELLLRALRGHIASRFGARLDVALGNELVRRTLDLPLPELEALSGKGVTERLRQLDLVRGFFTSHLPILLVDLAFVALFLAALFALAPTLAWITLAAMPGFVLLSLLAVRHQIAFTGTTTRLAAEKSACLNEALAHALSVKALGLETVIGRRFERRLLDSAWTGFRTGSLSATIGSLGQALQHLTALVVVYVGAREIIAGDLSIGALVAATILSGRTLAPMRQVVGGWQQVHQARGAYRELNAAAPARRAASHAAEGIKLEGSICIEEVTFRYAADRPAAIDGLSLEVEAGRLMALVGPPGSGKSTLVRLLLGLERPQNGRILIDGLDIAHLPDSVLRTQIGVVPQEIQLFAGTIADNILAGAAEGGFARAIAAAKFVGLRDTIEALPEGYETKLGDRGCGLSLGQRQLVAVARALVRNPHLLVLDEATGALDSETEAALLTSLKRAARGRTIIMITHRQSVLHACDRAALLHEGKLVRVGAPGEIAAALKQPASAARAAEPPTGETV
jgi:ABC-type bacteriocin/lantibiotic exporter with double-glycine peptidase domain